MLSTKNRIKKDKEFRKIFKKSEKSFANNLTFRVAKNFQGTTRFGFVVSNKIDKRATRRNSLRRKLRALARELMPDLVGSFDVIVIVSRPYKFPFSYQEIRSDFIAGLKRLRVIK